MSDIDPTRGAEKPAAEDFDRTPDKEDFGQAIASFTSDPNFYIILVGVAVWIIGPWIPLIDFLVVLGGFMLTAYAVTATSFKRPLTTAWPGVIIGILLYIVGWIFSLFPFIWLLTDPFQKVGMTLILFFIIPIAVQQGNVPLEGALKIVRKQAEKAEESVSTGTEEEKTEETETTE
ncbi:MAG: membrane protein of unknown function [Candidatus Thorarchaeota archaeon]|nr:MAG: membrane protein of unknown function [Candidatus Thorarchaeota archaeon]